MSKPGDVNYLFNKNIKRIAAIDPGNKGAIILFDTNKKKDGLIVYDMPTLETVGSGKTKKGNLKKKTLLDETEIRNILSNKIDHVLIEKSQSMPGQGAPATFNYGTSFGLLRGICVGMNIPYTLVHPSTWRRAIMKDMDKGKEANIVRAKQLFPNANIGKKDGRADALLILYYGLNFILV